MTTKEQNQITKVKRVSERVILDYATDGLAGIGWYGRAYDQVREVAEALGTYSERVAGIVSCLSPRVSVDRNCKLAAEYLTTANVHRGHEGAWHNVLRGEEYSRKFGTWCRVGSINALKIRAFAKALNGDPHAVVCDTWIAKVFGIPYGDEGLTQGAYDLIVSRFTAIAGRFDISPCDLQAAVWVGIRKEHGESDTVADITLREHCVAIVD